MSNIFQSQIFVLKLITFTHIYILWFIFKQ